VARWPGGISPSNRPPPGIAAFLGVLLIGMAVLVSPRDLKSQVPVTGEVRQIVSLSFLPGTAGEAVDLFERLAVPLYRQDPAMEHFRGFSEVESSIPLDLIVVSSFDGMAGMDRSNEFLAGAGIGAFYSRVAPVLSRHHDQFIEMIPDLGRADPSASPRTVLVWYRVVPGGSADFESAVRDVVLPLEEAMDVPSQTGRFLLGDGWHYLRFVGVESLGAYQAYWAALRQAEGYSRIDGRVTATREVIVRALEGLSVR